LSNVRGYECCLFRSKKDPTYDVQWWFVSKIWSKEIDSRFAQKAWPILERGSRVCQTHAAGSCCGFRLQKWTVHFKRRIWTLPISRKPTSQTSKTLCPQSRRHFGSGFGGRRVGPSASFWFGLSSFTRQLASFLVNPFYG